MGGVMKYVLIILLLIAIAIGCGGQKETKKAAFDDQKVTSACNQLILAFQGKLKQELLSALAEGGLENAVSICRMRAPAIADSFSQLTGVEITRVSLRQRNPRYSPDKFELAALAKFETSGSTGPQLETGFTLDSAGTRQFRYMQDIRVGQACLKCHGDPKSFPTVLKEALAENYPEDPAVGYEAGEHRGAFSITIIDPDADGSVSALLGNFGH